MTIFFQNISARKYSYYGSPKPDEEKSKEDEQTLADQSLARRRLQAKCQLVQTSYIKRILKIVPCLPYNKHLIN